MKIIKVLNDSRVNHSALDNYGNSYNDLITSFTAIRLASENGHLEVVKLLLSDSRVNPSAEDNYGKSYNDLI